MATTPTICQVCLTSTCSLATHFFSYISEKSLCGTDYDKVSHYSYDQTAELASAFLGLFVIIVCGAIFDGIAMKLNDYENHRTQDEYDDALILPSSELAISSE